MNTLRLREKRKCTDTETDSYLLNILHRREQERVRTQKDRETDADVLNTLRLQGQERVRKERTGRQTKIDRRTHTC